MKDYDYHKLRTTTMTSIDNIIVDIIKIRTEYFDTEKVYKDLEHIIVLLQFLYLALKQDDLFKEEEQ